MCCAGAGAGRCGGVLCAGPAYVVPPPGKRKRKKSLRPIRDQQSGFDEGWKVWHKMDWHMLVAKLPPEDQGVNARATGEVLAAQQSSNNDKGDVENTFQVLAELKKQQREAPFKAPQMDAPVQYTVLAEIPATNPADAHSTKKFGLHQPRTSPDSPWSVTGNSTTATTPSPLACHALDDLYGQDSVRSSDGFDGMYNEGDSDGLDYY